MASAGPPIYLDHAAATPLRPEVDAAMREAAWEAFGNASSPHALGRRARRTLEEARERIVAALGGITTGQLRDRLVFTSGASESNRLALLGRGGPPGAVAWSARDHASVAHAVEGLVRRGWRRVPLDLDGLGSTAAAAARFAAALPTSGPWATVCITPACSQTGTIDLPDSSVVGHPRIALHVDHAQAVAWIASPIRDLQAATLTVAPHKVGGPRGIGGLVIRGGTTLEPLQPGTQELGIRGGTEAVSLAVGFATAIEAAIAERAEATSRVTALRRRFEDGLVTVARAAGREAVVVGGSAARTPHIATIAVAGIDRQSLVMAADLAGVCLATGTACASGSSDPSAAVGALGLPAWVPHAAFRASFAAATTEADVDEALRRLADVFHGIAAGGLQRLPHSR